jgi:hypothetical protein
VLVLWAAPSVFAQSQDGSLSGTVLDAAARPLAGAKVTAKQPETGLALDVSADSHGEYAFGALPRGRYNISAAQAGYRTLEKQAIELAVGQKLVVDFVLYAGTPSGAPPAVDTLLAHLPPDPTLPVETIASSVSVVIDENQILQLPLASRNIYSLFLLEPGVTSQGAVASRGLSFAVHGQRVSGSAYLLDGVDNNQLVLTGPVTPSSTESVQELRMTNSSFSAENGRATAFVAQIVTRSGGNGFHGDLFEFLSNDKLNANTFENNASAAGKDHLRQNQFGTTVTGPLAKNSTFFSATLEASRLRYGSDRSFLLPTPSFISGLPQGSIARQLLTDFAPLASTPEPDNSNIGVARLEAPSRIDTLLATGRIDRNFTGGRDRLVLRYALASTDEQHGDDQEFTGYTSLWPTDSFHSYNSLFGWSHSFQAGQVNEFKIGWSRERIWLPRPQPDVPIIQINGSPLLLPGSKLQGDQREDNNLVQFSDLFSLRRGRSTLSWGLETRKNFENGLTLGLENEALGASARFANGFYLFPDLNSFVQGQALAFAISVDRFSSGALRLPDLRREYRSNEYAAFFQDDVKLSRRLSVNIGLRYEYFGVPHNIDRSKDVNFYFGPGSTIEERLANGVLRSTDQNPGDLRGLLYRRSLLNFAPSVGLAWDPLGKGGTVLRAGYAVAFDRVFDTLRDLRSNSEEVVTCFAFAGCSPNLVLPPRNLLPSLDQTLPPDVVVQLDQNLRTPYAENWYFGIQQTVTPNFVVEVGQVGSVGRKLISRDQVNRSINGISLNSQILEDTFLTNAGNSNYLALQIGLRRRFSRGLQYQVSYTFSHAVDNQSDNFEGVRTGPSPFDFELATFTRQFDPRVDRGNANFDQRHNLVFSSIWEVPVPRSIGPGHRLLLRGWTLSLIGAYRSGFPVTVICSICTDAGFYNNRADYVGRSGAPVTPPPSQQVAGGVQWLNPNLFQPATDHVGTLGRGAFAGPGFWNYDFALLRNLTVKEGSLRIQFRAEFYNLFNHANLSAPVTDMSASDFGQAYYGLSRTFSRFGDLPLDNPARRIQFGIRIQF